MQRENSNTNQGTSNDTGAPNFKAFAFWGLQMLLTGAVVLATSFMGGILAEIRSVNSTISSLNEKIAVVITTQGWHERTIDSLDSRVKSLERKEQGSGL